MQTDAVSRSSTSCFEKLRFETPYKLQVHNGFHNNPSLTRFHRSVSSNLERLNTQTARRDCVWILKFYDFFMFLQLLYTVSHKSGTTDDIGVFRQLSQNVHNIFTVHFDTEAFSSLRKRIELFVM